MNYRVAETYEKIVTILSCLDLWHGNFTFADLSEQIMISHPLPNSRGNSSFLRPRSIRDDDINNARGWFNRHLKWLKVGKHDAQDAIQLAARENIISPVRHYLEGLPPVAANEARALPKEVLGQHFGLRRFGEHPETLIYAEFVIRKLLISTVALIMEPLRS